MRNSAFPIDVALRPLCLKVGSGITPRGGASVYVDSGTALIRSQNIYNTEFAHDGLAFIDDQTAEKMKGVSIESSDILLNITGDSVARCCQVPDDVLPARVNQHVSIVRPDQDKLHPRYLMYYLVSPFMQAIMLSLAGSGGTRKALTKTMIERFRIPLPDLPKQRKIASILSAYDDLIENNQRRIALLERAARELYREWFVRLRFPGHEHTRIVYGVPEGWEQRTLRDVLSSLESGGRPKGGAKEEGIPSIGAENVTGIGQYDFTKEKYVPEVYFDTMRKGVLRSRDVVVYKDGANIGRSSYFGDGFPHEKCAVNEHVFILRVLPEVGQSFLYFWVAQDKTRQRIANLNANTAQPGVSQGKLKSLVFVQPSRVIADQFNEDVEPVIQQVFLLARANHRLIEARDLLLPRLMSGEVAV